MELKPNLDDLKQAELPDPVELPRLKMAKLKKDGTPKLSGGVRKNQNGRPPKYGEQTASLNIRVPISKKPLVKKAVQAMLDEWAR